METTTFSNMMISLIVLYDMHTKYFVKAIQDIKDDDAHNRLETKANHVASIKGSLVHERYEIAKEPGVEEKQITGGLFHDYRGIKTSIPYLENIDARFLTTFIINPKKLSHDELNMMVKFEKFVHMADWLYAYVIKIYPDKKALRKEWMNSKNVMCACAGWSLTSGYVTKSRDALDLPPILDKIETEMAGTYFSLAYNKLIK